MAKIVIPFVVSLALLPSARFAIGHDGDGSGISAVAQTSLTFSHTVTSNTNGALLLSAHYGSGNTNAVSTVTYNGDSLNFINKNENSVNHLAVEFWQLVTPDTGTHDIVITMTGATGGTQKIAGCSSSWTGVDQSTPIDVSGGTEGGPGTAVSGSVTTNTDGAYVIAGVSGTNDNSSATSTQTEYCDINPSGSTPFPFGAYTQKATAGSQTMDATLNAGFRWVIGIAALKPTGAAAPNFVPGIINNPMRGGGLPWDWFVCQLECGRW